ncbi:hypothetical protein HZS_5337 [Henneguya salminicola]|nr:hypothetical protein HZS_5337 [Henneguya salminicola]
MKLANSVEFNNNKINSNVIKSLELYSPPILISLKINSKNRVFEMDTGSPISVINQKSFSNIDSPIKSTKAYLTSFTGHEIKFIGVCSVSVSKDSASFTGNLFVVETGRNIVGRDWINLLGWLPPEKVLCMPTLSLDELL